MNESRANEVLEVLKGRAEEDYFAMAWADQINAAVKQGGKLEEIVDSITTNAERWMNSDDSTMSEKTRETTNLILSGDSNGGDGDEGDGEDRDSEEGDSEGSQPEEEDLANVVEHEEGDETDGNS